MLDERQMEIVRDILCMVKELEPDYLYSLACTMADIDCNVRKVPRTIWAAEFVTNGIIVDEALKED